MARGKRVTLVLGDAAALGTDRLRPNESGSGSTPAAQERRLRIAAFLVGKGLDRKFIDAIATAEVGSALDILRNEVTPRNPNLYGFERKEAWGIYDLLIERRDEVTAALTRFNEGGDFLGEIDAAQPFSQSDSQVSEVALNKPALSQEDVIAIASELWRATEYGREILRLYRIPGEGLMLARSYILTHLYLEDKRYEKLNAENNPQILVDALIACEQAMTKRS